MIVVAGNCWVNFRPGVRTPFDFLCRFHPDSSTSKPWRPFFGGSQVLNPTPLLTNLAKRSPQEKHVKEGVTILDDRFLAPADRRRKYQKNVVLLFVEGGRGGVSPLKITTM